LALVGFEAEGGETGGVRGGGGETDALPLQDVASGVIGIGDREAVAIVDLNEASRGIVGVANRGGKKRGREKDCGEKELLFGPVEVETRRRGAEVGAGGRFVTGGGQLFLLRRFRGG